MSAGKAGLLERAADSKPLMAVGSVCSVVALPFSVLSMSGVQMPGMLDAIGRTSFVWLPVLLFATGFLIGWNSHKSKMAKDGITAERIEELKGRLDAIDSAEARDRARIDEFTDAQLELMLRMADAPSPGLSLFITSHDHTLAMSLMEPPEVIAMFIDETRSTCAWYLLPKWNGWVRRNREEIENRLANP